MDPRARGPCLRVYPRALLACAVLVLLLGAGADDDLERLMPDVEVAPCPRHA